MRLRTQDTVAHGFTQVTLNYRCFPLIWILHLCSERMASRWLSPQPKKLYAAVGNDQV